MSEEFFTWLEIKAKERIAETLHEIATHFSATLFRGCILLDQTKDVFEYHYTYENGFNIIIEGRVELDATNPPRIVCGIIEMAIPLNHHEDDKFELIYSAGIGDKTGEFYWAPINSSTKIDLVFEAHRNADTMVGETIKQLRSSGIYYEQ